MSDHGLTINSSMPNISSMTQVFDQNYFNAFKYESENRNIVWFGDGGFYFNNIMPTTCLVGVLVGVDSI